MRKIVILLFLLVYHANAFAGGHISQVDIEKLRGTLK